MIEIEMYECRLRPSGTLKVRDSSSYCRNAREARSVLVGLFEDLAHEQVWCLLLDARFSIRGVVRLAEGGLHGCSLIPSDVLRPVIAAGVVHFVLSHNHPSGDATPSRSDREMTAAVERAADVVGLHLVDHIIVTTPEGEWSSIVHGQDGKNASRDW